MSIFSGTRNAKNELKKICSNTELNKFINADYEKLSGNVSNVGTFFTYANAKSQWAIKTFADALNLDNNMQRFLNAVEKQAKSLGTKKSGLFYKLIYNNVHQKIKSTSNWNKEVGTLKQFEKEIRKFLLSKKDQDITEDDAPEDLEKLSDIEKQCIENRRKKNSNIVEKLKSGRLSNRLKIFMALVLWKYVTDKIKELGKQTQPTTTTSTTTTATTSSAPESVPESLPDPEPKPELNPANASEPGKGEHGLQDKKNSIDQTNKYIKDHPGKFGIRLLNDQRGRLEMYDSLRLEYLNKFNGNLGQRYKALTYKTKALTGYEARIMKYLVNGDLEADFDESHTYADISIHALFDVQLSLIELQNRCSVFDTINNSKQKNITEKNVVAIFKDLKELNRLYEINKFVKLSDHDSSVMACLNDSDYYTKNRDTLENKYGKYYLDPNDLKLYLTTVNRAIPSKIEEEIKNRINFLELKEQYDEDDFIRVSKKIKAFYEKGLFKQGDELLSYYTCHGDTILNNVARGNFSLCKLDNPKLIIGESLFARTILELANVKQQFTNSKLNLSEKEIKIIPSKPDLQKVEYLYRGFGFEDLVTTLSVDRDAKKWLEGVDALTCDDTFKARILKYLPGKMLIDNAIMSTSLYKVVAYSYSHNTSCGSVILKIDVSNYKGGIDMCNVSYFSGVPGGGGGENEVTLPPRIKLEITSAQYVSAHNKKVDGLYAEVMGSPYLEVCVKPI